MAGFLVLIITWICGWIVFHVTSMLIHILLVVALVCLILHFVEGDMLRRTCVLEVDSACGTEGPASCSQYPNGLVLDTISYVGRGLIRQGCANCVEGKRPPQVPKVAS